MAVAYISEFPIGDRSTENYEFMKMVKPEELPRPDTAAQRPTREGFYELHDLVTSQPE